MDTQPSSAIPKCVIGLCVKNNSAGLPKVFDNIHRLRKLFSGCSVIAYYDRSNDSSLELLRMLGSYYAIDLHILNEESKGPVARTRTVNIANARNNILREIYTNELFSEYELFAMMDSNDYSCQGTINTDVVGKYLNRSHTTSGNALYDMWDSLSFARVPYYDLWAYSDGKFQIGCWCYPRMVRKQGETTCFQFQDAIRQHLDTTIFSSENAGKLVEVDSAFCGFAFYKKSVFSGCYYNGLWSTTYMDKELLRENLEQFPLWRNNQRDDCEHRHFHMMAKRLKCARIMIACDQAFTENDGNKHLADSIVTNN